SPQAANSSSCGALFSCAKRCAGCTPHCTPFLLSKPCVFLLLPSAWGDCATFKNPRSLDIAHPVLAAVLQTVLDRGIRDSKFFRDFPNRHPESRQLGNPGIAGDLRIGDGPDGFPTRPC